MSPLCLKANRRWGRRYGIEKTTLRGHASFRTMFKRLAKYRFLSLLACLILLAPMSMYGQTASDYADSRLSCAQGFAQRVVDRVRAMGAQKGSAEVCVKALSWTAKNSNLLDIYMRGTGQASARLLITRFTESAKSSTSPFRPDSSPLQMWNRGELTPSLAFDAGFARSYLEKSRAPSTSMNSAELQRRTEGCLNETQSLAVCADAGRIQGALAYQMNNAFSDDSAASAPPSESQGPDKAQTAAAIDRKFQVWAQSWSWDRYRPGSVQVTSMNCSDQCKASGQFSFVRMGALHTIAFVAFLPSTGDGKYSLGRLCYNDDTTNQLDCTE
jgi:hypothetical protein